MRFTEIDLQIEAIMWFGVDKNGYIFVCHSSWLPNIPEFVCNNKEETEFLDKYFMKYLEMKDDDWGESNFYIEKGISYFDGIIEEIPPDKDFELYPYWYRQLGEVKNPLHFAQLPKKIQKIMNFHRMDIDITKTKYFYVEKAKFDNN